MKGAPIMNTLVKTLFAFVLAAGIFFWPQGVSAKSSTAQGDPLTVSESVSPRQQQAALTYWTRERIATAPAMAMPVDRDRGGIDAAAVEEVAGPEESSPPGRPVLNANLVARAAFAEDWKDVKRDFAAQEDLSSGVFTDEPAGTAGVYTYYDVNRQSVLWKIHPHKWDGKFTFNTPTGSSSCSATVISGNNIVLAAHCVYDTAQNNKFYTQKVFTPAFRNGSAPYGTFTTTNCSVLTQWVNLSGNYSINTWARHDVAVCSLGKNSAGQTINQAVGFAGRLWNSGNNQLVFNSGYPARNYNDQILSNGPAQYLRSCTAETFLQTTDTLGMGCYWGRGISGGSWLVGYKIAVASGQVNSVNSGLYVGQQNMYGPKFTSNNIVPLCTARGC
jgi:hypothetical protein